jgi:hypothetical protein
MKVLKNNSKTSYAVLPLALLASLAIHPAQAMKAAQKRARVLLGHIVPAQGQTNLKPIKTASTDAKTEEKLEQDKHYKINEELCSDIIFEIAMIPTETDEEMLARAHAYSAARELILKNTPSQLVQDKMRELKNRAEKRQAILSKMAQ